MKEGLIYKTKNGKLFKCNECQKFHLEFKNLNFNFSTEQLEKFAEYIKGINGKKWENINKNSTFERKIIIPIGHKTLRVLFNVEELLELKELLSPSNRISPNLSQKITACQIDFTAYRN